MIVNSFNVEFGYELLTALPYAYYLHKQGRLKGTISAPGSEALYWFSPNHKINTDPRGWNNIKPFRASGLPNVWIHQPTFDFSKFAVPPFAEHYARMMAQPTKPLVCICNRYNVEWGIRAINYFDLECLDRLFTMLGERYQVIYWAVDLPDELSDGAKMLPLRDREMIYNKHPEVIVFQDIMEMTGYDWNTLQLILFSHCKKFLTMNGGYSILASYFGGTNLIYSKRCSEIRPDVDSFNRWYHKIGGSKIVPVKTYDDLYQKVRDEFLPEQPLINILIRTSGRPVFFNECMRSIREQTYKNVNVIVGTDDESSAAYVKPYRVKKVRYVRNTNVPDPPPTLADGRPCYGRKAHYNRYLNNLGRRVKDGWVLYHDDDLFFTSPTVLQDAVDQITSDDDLILWRMYTNGGVVPQDKNFGRPPWNCDITASCLFHSKYLPLVHWEPYRKGNYRVMAVLYKALNPVWIDRIMVTTGPAGNGLRNDMDVAIDKLYI